MLARTRSIAALLFLPALLFTGLEVRGQAPSVSFPLKKSDRVAWIGSSSTNIGVWPKTMEFLLRTRHPDLQLDFKKFSTGGGTFATGLQNIDKWLAEYKPTVVFFNYGGNDAGAGEKGLPQFKDNMAKSATKAQAAGARVIFMPPQAADVRKAGEEPSARRRLYADALLSFAKEKNWLAVDIHHPIDRLQQSAQKDDEAYTILSDKIHLTAPAYIAWGYFLYKGLNPPAADSAAEMAADGKVLATSRCKIQDVKADQGSLSFTRLDEILPILPPGPLPPRKYVPLEKWSAHGLKITGLEEGKYEVLGDGKSLGIVAAAVLAKGVNLNTLVLDNKSTPPWESLAKQLWAGKELDRIGKTSFRFEVRKAGS